MTLVQVAKEEEAIGIHDPATRAALRSRLDALQPNAPRQWAK